MSTLKLEELKFLKNKIASDCNLDLNYSSVPTLEQVKNKPKFPFYPFDSDSYKMLEIWWKLDGLIKELEPVSKNCSFANIVIELQKPFISDIPAT